MGAGTPCRLTSLLALSLCRGEQGIPSSPCRGHAEDRGACQGPEGEMGPKENREQWGWGLQLCFAESVHACN